VTGTTEPEHIEDLSQGFNIALKADRDDESASLDDQFHFNAEPDTELSATAPHKKGNSQTDGLPWVPTALAAAMVVMIFLLLWGNTRTLSQSPGLASFAETLCELSSCEHLLPSDFDSLAATQQEIVQNNTQLFADLLLNNPNEAPLPFPAILVELRNSSGKVIAEHLFQPDSYLKGKPFADHMLPPDLPVSLTLPIQAKVKDLSNFTVRYYPPAE